MQRVLFSTGEICASTKITDPLKPSLVKKTLDFKGVKCTNLVTMKLPVLRACRTHFGSRLKNLQISLLVDKLQKLFYSSSKGKFLSHSHRRIRGQKPFLSLKASSIFVEINVSQWPWVPPDRVDRKLERNREEESGGLTSGWLPLWGPHWQTTWTREWKWGRQRDGWETDKSFLLDIQVSLGGSRGNSLSRAEGSPLRERHHTL